MNKPSDKKRLSDIFQVIIFILFIGIFFILFLVLPKRDFSEQENRYLQQLPRLSAASLFSGKFTEDFQRYTTDQFPFRDGWTAVKARAEAFMGKTENNGVYFCEDNTLIDKFVLANTAQPDINVSAVSKFAAESGIPVYFALIPGAAEVWSYKLPKNAPNDSQEIIISQAYYTCSNAINIDMLNILSAHSDEYIYYRTDHHWTTLGAYFGYSAIMNAMGLNAKPIAGYDRQTVSRSFYGTAYSASGISWIPPDSIETFIREPEDILFYRYDKPDEPTQSKIYDESFLSKKDKYSMFMGGNVPLEIITNTQNNSASTVSPESKKPKLLIIRDSFMDSLTPFLADDFSEIHIIDLRYFSDSLRGYIAKNNFDAALICYSVANFVADRNIFLLNK